MHWFYIHIQVPVLQSILYINNILIIYVLNNIIVLHLKCSARRVRLRLQEIRGDKSSWMRLTYGEIASGGGGGGRGGGGYNEGGWPPCAPPQCTPGMYESRHSPYIGLCLSSRHRSTLHTKRSQTACGQETACMEWKGTQPTVRSGAMEGHAANCT